MSEIKVSVQGYDYTDLEKFLSLNSDQRTQKALMSGIETVNVPASFYTELVIPHNLGYAPTYQVYHTFDNTDTFKIPMGSRTLFGSTGVGSHWMNETNLHIFITNTTASQITRKIRYIIYATDME